jgi:hypothetical protein
MLLVLLFNLEMQGWELAKMLLLFLIWVCNRQMRRRRLHECLAPDTRSVQLCCISACRQTLAGCYFTAWVPGTRHSLDTTLLHECLEPDTRSVQLYCMNAWSQTLARCNFAAWVPGARHFTAWMSGARHSFRQLYSGVAHCQNLVHFPPSPKWPKIPPFSLSMAKWEVKPLLAPDTVSF